MISILFRSDNPDFSKLFILFCSLRTILDINLLYILLTSNIILGGLSKIKYSKIVQGIKNTGKILAAGAAAKAYSYLLDYSKEKVKDISSKFKDPSNLIPNYSIEEYKQITDSIVASSPYEDAVRTHVGNVLHLLELHLTLSLCMICIVLFIIYVFTIKLFFEKHVNVNSNSNSTSNFTSTYISNFILKLPFGKTLQYFVNKMVVVIKYSGNIWFYYMFFCLLIATIGSSYCIYICILILKMIPS